MSDFDGVAAAAAAGTPPLPGRLVAPRTVLQMAVLVPADVVGVVVAGGDGYAAADLGADAGHIAVLPDAVLSDGSSAAAVPAVMRQRSNAVAAPVTARREL